MNEKIEKYFKLLHPEYDGLEPGKQTELMDDRAFIANHIDEIDKICKEHGIEHNGMTEQPILQEAIKRLREEIPVQRIGQATINTPTAAKKKAEQVENNENTRDNIKEGEEVGIDYTEEQIEKIAKSRLHEEIKAGVQTIQYQINTFSTTNGQAPFLSIFISFITFSEI